MPNNYLKLFKNKLTENESKIFISINLLPIIFSNKDCKNIPINIVNYLEKNFNEVIMSSDTLNLCNTKKVFDVKNTPSYGRGNIPNTIIDNGRFNRSIHPFVSCISIGKENYKMPNKANSIHGYGYLSPYDYMYKNDFSIFTIDLPIMQTTIIHHCENIANVPYRYTKLFKQEVIDWDGNLTNDYWAINVLYKDLMNSQRDQGNYLWIKYKLEEKIDKLEIDNHIIRKIKYKKLVDIITEIIIKEPSIWLGENKKFNKELPFYK